MDRLRPMCSAAADVPAIILWYVGFPIGYVLAYLMVGICNGWYVSTVRFRQTLLRWELERVANELAYTRAPKEPDDG